MVTIKSYTDIEQSKKLAKILPIESADMVLPFRHTKNDEYIPGYVVSRNYVEVYNEMMKLPGMGKEDVCQLIQPAWSIAALFDVLPDNCGINKEDRKYVGYAVSDECGTYTSDNLVDACVSMIEYLHELKESEDEKIRKEIVEIFKSAQRDGICEPIKNEQFEKIFAWLEKQGEQKTLSKTEPIVEGLTTEFQKQVSHLIASAMDKEHEYNEGFVKWTANVLLNYAKHELEKQVGQKQNVTDIVSDLENYFSTTTKEQQEKDWDEIKNWEEKHFNHDKHIEIISTNKVEPKFKVGDIITNKKSKDTVKIVQILHDSYCYSGWDGAATVHSDFSISEQDNWELVEQKPTWSEEDDKILNEFIESLRYSNGNGYNKQIDWLKSLKDRIQPQLKQEWSKEDGEMVETLNEYVKNLDILFSEIKIGDKDILSNEFREKVQHWLKSFKERYTWKPSDEQMKFLWKYAEQNNYDGRILGTLYNDLKKLREE